MKRLVYEGRVRFPYGFHTGDGRRQGASDQPLYRDHDGALVLSGESLAGALRADMEKMAAASGGSAGTCKRTPECQCPVCELMGPRAGATRRRGDPEKPLRASRLFVSGGRATGRPSVSVRDRVGIDRKTRTAAARRKFDAEVVDPGVEFPLQLRCDVEERPPELLEATLRRLAEGWIFLGGKRSSGLGRAELVELDRHEIDLAAPAELVAHLKGDAAGAGGSTTRLVTGSGARWPEGWGSLRGGTGPTEEEAPDGSGEGAAGGSAAPGWGQVRLRLRIHFPWSYLVSDPAQALEEDVHHAFVRLPDGRAFLPGSALRGALRSRAEQVLRTFGGDRAACDLNTRGGSCHERIQKENRRRQGANEKPLTPQEEIDRHCLACRVFGSGRLASSVRITDSLPGEAPSQTTRDQEFVAIDRFAGGAAPGLKFTSQMADEARLEGEVHLELGPDRLEPWGLGLLSLVLRDLLWGDVPVGFGSAKGLNEHEARLLGVDRFWLRPPAAVAHLDGDRAQGTVSWAPEGGGLADPPDLEGMLPPERIEGIAEWVRALHRRLEALPPASLGPEEGGASG